MYQVIIIGAGKIGAFFDRPDSPEVLTHAHAFTLASGFSLRGFYDVDREQASRAARRWGGIAFDSLQEALTGTDIVCCAVPDAYHYAVLKEAARYPVRFVFCEKPVTSSWEQAVEIKKLYEESGIPLQINYTRRFLQEFAQLREDILKYGRFVKGTGYYGKGILHNGSHMIDLLAFLLGGADSGRRTGELVCDFYEEDPSADAILQIGSGTFYMQAVDCRIATIFELELFFEKARISITMGGAAITVHRVRPAPGFEGYFNYIPSETIAVKYDRAFESAINNMARYLEGREALRSPLEDAMRSMRLCLAIRGDL